VTRAVVVVAVSIADDAGGDIQAVAVAIAMAVATMAVALSMQVPGSPMAVAAVVDPLALLREATNWLQAKLWFLVALLRVPMHLQ
jgi:hypothetical protein